MAPGDGPPQGRFRQATDNPNPQRTVAIPATRPQPPLPLVTPQGG